MPAAAIRVPLVRARLGRFDDARLAALAAEGDERAFEALYDRHHRALLGYCRHLLGSREEGEDALQQAFLRAHRALLDRGAPDEPRPWLFAIARNRCLSMLAARREAARVEDHEVSTEGLGAAVERRADLQALLADISALPEDQRSALVLAELGDLSHAEIASVIDVPAAKVKALVHQARTRLIATREARETPCPDVREQLATARGGELRRGPLRRHLALCEPCREYGDAVRRQRAALGLVLPVLPSAGLKEAILGAISGGGGGTAAGTAIAGGAALSSAAPAGLAAKGIAAKLAIGAALAGGAGGGAVAVTELSSAPPARPAAAQPAGAAPAGGGTGTTIGTDETEAAEREAERRRAARGVRPRSRSGDRGASEAVRKDAAAREEAAARKRDKAQDKAARTEARTEDNTARRDARELAKAERVAGKDQTRAERIATRDGRKAAGGLRPAPATGRGTPASGTERAPAKAPPVRLKPPVKPRATPAPLPTATATPEPVRAKGRGKVLEQPLP